MSPPKSRSGRSIHVEKLAEAKKLHDESELSWSEIAARLGLSVSGAYLRRNVGRYLYKAKASPTDLSSPSPSPPIPKGALLDLPDLSIPPIRTDPLDENRAYDELEHAVYDLRDDLSVLFDRLSKLETDTVLRSVEPLDPPSRDPVPPTGAVDSDFLGDLDLRLRVREATASIPSGLFDDLREAKSSSSSSPGPDSPDRTLSGRADEVGSGPGSGSLRVGLLSPASRTDPGRDDSLATPDPKYGDRPSSSSES